MSTFSNADAAKSYAADYRHNKVWGQTLAAGDVFVDYDPGVDGPTDPSPPTGDPTENDIEAYVLAREARTMWEIKNAWEKGQP